VPDTEARREQQLDDGAGPAADTGCFEDELELGATDGEA